MSSAPRCGWNSLPPAWCARSTRRWIDARMTEQAETRSRVLLVEDEAMIAMLIEDMLADLGCDVVATAGQLGEAVSLARSGSFDLAFLDLNLRGVPSYPVAQALRERGIPFAFVTGYGTA